MRTFDRILGVFSVAMGSCIIISQGFENPGAFLQLLIGLYVIWKSVHGRY